MKKEISRTSANFTEKEIKNCLDSVERILRISDKESQGMVIICEGVKRGKELTYKSMGTIKSMSTARVMALVLDAIKLDPMDGAILLAQIDKVYKDFKKK